MPARTLPESSVRPVWTSDDGSMARETALTRWPRLVQAMTDDITATAKASIEPQLSEAEELITHLMSLKGEIIADAALK
jgi:damage-control phosphatase, subfamily III